MASVVVLPIHDPAGELLPRLPRVMPHVEGIFAGAFLGITAATVESQPEWVEWLKTRTFFRCMIHRPGLAVGDQFRELYVSAAAAYPPDTLLHLCFVDRLAFILQSEYCQQFTDDMLAARYDESPLIFHRSEAAWATHPANYRAAEQMVTTAGQLLFGRTLDFAWCHLVMRADTLGAIIPRTKRPDMSMVAEIVVQAMRQRHPHQGRGLAGLGRSISDGPRCLPAQARARGESSGDAKTVGLRHPDAPDPRRGGERDSPFAVATAHAHAQTTDAITHRVIAPSTNLRNRAERCHNDV